jgi:protein gp37
MGIEKYREGFELRLHEDSSDVPHDWKKPKVVFVNSMSRCFSQGCSASFYPKSFSVMNNTPQHTYKFLLNGQKDCMNCT